MKPNCFSCCPAGLSVGREACAQTAPLAKSPDPRRCGALLFAALALVLSGCTSQRGVFSNSFSPGTSGFAESRSCRFGSVALADDPSPASFSFQKAKGKLG